MLARLAILIALVSALGCDSAPSAKLPGAVALSDVGDRSATYEKKTGLAIRTRAVVDFPETVYDFGNMDPVSSGSHKFTVRNVGSAPLKLRLLDTSCKCTVGKVDDGDVPPDGATTITMEWNTGDKVSYYSQWATIETNDPELPQIVLNIKGFVRQDIRFEPEEIVFGDLDPTASYEREVLVVSQRFKDFKIAKLTPTKPSFLCDIAPATPEQLQQHEALSGYLVRIQSPTNLPKGAFRELLDFEIDAGEESPRKFAIPFAGHVRGRLSLMGNGVNSLGHIDLGVLGYGQGKVATAKLKVRDELQTLNVTSIKTTPEFMQVELKPFKASAPGIYDLTIRIPESTAPCAHRGDAAGEIVLQFDHPRIPEFRLWVDFSIRPAPEARQ